MMVDLDAVVDVDPEEVGVTEQVYYPVLAGILEETAGEMCIRDRCGVPQGNQILGKSRPSGQHLSRRG